MKRVEQGKAKQEQVRELLHNTGRGCGDVVWRGGRGVCVRRMQGKEGLTKLGDCLDVGGVGSRNRCLAPGGSDCGQGWSLQRQERMEEAREERGEGGGLGGGRKGREEEEKGNRMEGGGRGRGRREEEGLFFFLRGRG